MRGPQVLALIKAFAAHIPDAIDPFSRDSSQSEDEAHLLSPFDSPSVPILDRDLQYEHYPEAVRHLRPSFPPTCAFVEPDDVKVVGDIPISAGGFTDIWEGVIDGRSIFQKSYRCYEYCDIERIFQRYLGEVWAYTQLSHPNVVRFVGINPAPSHPFSLVLDTAGHLDLTEYLHKSPKADRSKLALGIARGLQHMHDGGIIHGHLASNVLVGPDGTPRITGLGSSFMISRPDLSSGKGAMGFYRGSAPELVRPQKPGKPATRITKSSDVYAFGMLIWEIYSGNIPFPEELDATVICRVLRGDRPSRPDHHAGLSDRMWKMIKACWSDLPSRRVTIGEIVMVIEAE